MLARSDWDGAARIEAAPGALTVERFRDTRRRYWMDDPKAAPAGRAPRANDNGSDNDNDNDNDNPTRTDKTETDTD